MSSDISLVYYLKLYKKNWLLIVLIMGLAMLASGFMASRQPVVYRSVVSVLFSEQQNQLSGLGGLFGIQTQSSSRDIIFSILQSNRMREDINSHFNPEDDREIWWTLSPYSVTGGFAVEITGPEPELTKEIADFAIQNLDKINLELQITASKPMVKVLDPAVIGASMPKNVVKRILIAGIFSLFSMSLIMFSVDYIVGLKKKG